MQRQPRLETFVVFMTASVRPSKPCAPGAERRLSEGRGSAPVRPMGKLVLGVVLCGVVACTGPRGADGERGPQGVAGPAGAEGTNGTDGTDGLDGLDGSAGPAGPKGDAGADALSPWVVGAGLQLHIDSADVSATQARVSVRLSDAAGTPLDPAGQYTAGPVTFELLVAQVATDDAGVVGDHRVYTLDGGQPALTRAVVVSPVAIEQGRSLVTFTDPVLSSFELGRAQTVLLVATRTFDGATFVRSAAVIGRPRNVVNTDACNGCHGALTHHAAARFDDVQQCVVCHQSQLAMADGGTALRFGTLVHQLHRGRDLPSVLAGTPLQLGARDYSTVGFPRTLAHCDGCHGNFVAGEVWKSRPSREACGSCHDRTSLASSVPPPLFTAHPGGAFADADCAVCHTPPVIAQQHADPSFAGPNLLLTIDAVTNTAPGQAPVVDFTAKVDNVARDLVAAPFSSMRVTVAGPNSDFVTDVTSTIQGPGATGTLSVLDATAGRHRYQFPASAQVPLVATGSYTLMLEGSLLAGLVRATARSPVRAFAVTDPSPVARREIIDPAKCDACHLQLRGHGGARGGAASCVLCHSSGRANRQGVARREGTTVLAQSVDFKVMIHQLHMGARLTQPWSLGGFPFPSPVNPDGAPGLLAQTRYPQSPGACRSCHLEQPARTWTLPLPRLTPSVLEEYTCSEDAASDVDSYCSAPFWQVSATTRLPPESAVCTSCHDQPWVVAHAQINTSLTGVESCTTCHGAGASSDVEAVHAR